jgi:hypothetical protein
MAHLITRPPSRLCSHATETHQRGKNHTFQLRTFPASICSKRVVLHKRTPPPVVIVRSKWLWSRVLFGATWARRWRLHNNTLRCFFFPLRTTVHILSKQLTLTSGMYFHHVSLSVREERHNLFHWHTTCSKSLTFVNSQIRATDNQHKMGDSWTNTPCICRVLVGGRLTEFIGAQSTAAANEQDSGDVLQLWASLRFLWVSLRF